MNLHGIVDNFGDYSRMMMMRFLGGQSVAVVDPPDLTNSKTESLGKEKSLDSKLELFQS